MDSEKPDPRLHVQSRNGRPPIGLGKSEQDRVLAPGNSRLNDTISLLGHP